MQTAILARAQEAPKPYEHQPYPSWRYHRSGESKIINTPEEHDALVAEGDWSDTPATFVEPAAEQAADPAEQTPEPAAKPKTSKR
jgi:hypothetical protein